MTRIGFNTAGSHVIISGCSDGGKSTLLDELKRRGWATVPEPGRRVVEEQRQVGGRAVPWIDLAAFARRALEIASRDRERAMQFKGWVFFDRGLVDAAAALEYAEGIAISHSLYGTERFHGQVFLAPPWPAIFRADDDRRHDMEAAVAEYERLIVAYGDLGYEIVILPKAPVGARADFIVERLS